MRKDCHDLEKIPVVFSKVAVKHTILAPIIRCSNIRPVSLNEGRLDRRDRGQSDRRADILLVDRFISIPINWGRSGMSKKRLNASIAVKLPAVSSGKDKEV